jgi:hypothetical protein
MNTDGSMDDESFRELYELQGARHQAWAEHWAKQIERAQHITHAVIRGVRYLRLRYGSSFDDHFETCGDCGVVKGQLHVECCDVDACPKCCGQAISCGCRR